jgi:hypothetical protein
MGYTREQAQRWIEQQQLQHHAPAEAGAAPCDPDDEESDEPFAVWPDNWPVVSLFMRCQTRWRWATLPDGRTRPEGLRMADVVAWAREVRLPDRKRVLDELAEMEQAVVGAWAKRLEAQGEQ